MKNNWPIQELGTVAQVIAGQSPEGKSYNHDSIGTPFYQGKKDYGDRYLLPPTVWTTQETKIAEPGDLLISVRAPVGALNFTNQRICIGRGLAAIRTQKLLPDFLFYILSNLSIKGKDGAVFASINRTDIEAISIPVPPLPEQERIVGILDAAFEKIDAMKRNAEQNLQNSKELFQQALSEAMTPKDGWEKHLLKDICLDFGRGRSRHRPRNDKKLYGGQYPFIQTGDVRNSIHYVSEYHQTYNDFGLEQSKLWPAGTLCITIAANIAETAILSFDACFPDSVIGCVVDGKTIDIDFLEYLLQDFKSALQKVGKGSAQDNINLATFEQQLFPIPLDINIQKGIVKKLNRLSADCQQMQSHYDKICADCDELKKAILTKAFAGEL